MTRKNVILLQENATFLGRFLFYFDKLAHNVSFYIKRHSLSVEIFFLMIYVILNLFLIYIVREPKISVFITLLLFVISVERLVIHLKAKIEKEILEKKEEQIKQELADYDEIFNGLQYEKKDLESRNRILKKQKEYLVKKVQELGLKSKTLLKNKG
jgi:uncharacterized membrane protein